MSAQCTRAGLRFLTIFCICASTALCSQVVWRNAGESVTIQCRYKSQDIQAISLKKGLSKNEDIFYKTKTSKANKIKSPQTKIEEYVKFPNFDILLKNVTKNDTGAYWCLCKKFNITTSKTDSDSGEGSVLLVVTDPTVDDGLKAADQPCASSDQTLVVVSLVISALMLLFIFITLLLFLILKKHKNKPTPVPRNDVYEEMRGTIRH